MEGKKDERGLQDQTARPNKPGIDKSVTMNKQEPPRIDYCNSLLIGFPKTRLAPVQSVLNAAARMIARLPPYSHISDYMINELHWLQSLARVRYKVLLLVAKSQQGLAPQYLFEVMSKPPSAAPLVRCALLIVVIFLYLGPVLLYPRIGPLLWWVLHYGMTLLLHFGV